MTYPQPPSPYTPVPPAATPPIVVQRPPGNGVAVASLVLGIISVAFGVWMVIPIVGFFVAFTAGPCAIVAVVLGHVGMNRSRLVGVGRNQALAGLILGYSTLAIAVGAAIFWTIAVIVSGATA